MNPRLTPQTEAERTIHAALVVFLSDPERLSTSPSQFRSVCKTSPEYTLSMIDQYRTSLLHLTGACRAEIAEMVRTVEWEMRGTSTYIEYHRLDGTEDAKFIYERLTTRPEEFSRDDLLALARYFRHSEHSLRRAALQALDRQVVSFAERIAAEPPGLSADMESLKRSILEYGFSPDLNAILEKIDDALRDGGDSFDQAATMRHIRSFFEKLHESVGKELQARKPKVGNGTPLGQCGNVIEYLERKGVTTEKIKNLGRCLYSILSDRDFGVHALKASRDYTRLCRNMVVEYAVTLFFELERRLAEPGDS